jgi:hypothetical protein
VPFHAVVAIHQARLPSTRFRTRSTIVEHECRGIDPHQSSSFQGRGRNPYLSLLRWPR